jgi:hypothetical protein
VKFYQPSPAFFGVAPPAGLFYNGGSVTALVPYIFPIALDGRPYMPDLSQPFYRQQRRQLEPLIRTQADTSNEPGEQTMDPNGLWRRSFEDWVLGAGQRYLDRSTSVPNGYWASKGVDTLTTKWQVSLLPDVRNVGPSSSANPLLIWAAAYMYVIEGGAVYYTAISNVFPGASPPWTLIPGLPSGQVSSACTDGYSIYLAYGAAGIWKVDPVGVLTQYVSAAIDTAAVIGYANGRLMLGNLNSVYNIIAGGASLGTALIVFGNPNARVTCFAEGNNWLYIGMNVGGIGYIYGTQTTSDGTTLEPPSVQGQLPNGEKIYSMYGYLGYLVVGSGLGVRTCQQGSTGVTLGTLIPTPSPVMCLVAWGAFVWFGWTNYDSASTGLGKLSLTNWVVEGLLPAYSSDRMAAGQGVVNSTIILNGHVLFAVVGMGFFLDAATLVGSGTVQSGYILYDLTDPKVPALLDVQGAAAQEHGTYAMSVSVDGGPFQQVGSAAPVALITNTYTLSLVSGSRFEVLMTLYADVVTPSTGPVITRWTLRSYPAPLRPRTWQLPLVLNTVVQDQTGQDWEFDPETEINALEQMANNAVPVVYQEGYEAYLVFVTDVSFIARTVTTDRHYFNGLALVNIQSIPVAST